MNSTPPMAFFSDLLGLRRGMADELADQVVAGDGDQVALAHVAER